MNPNSLSPEDREEARKIFQGEVSEVSACQHCGGIHARVVALSTNWQPCPRIKRIERHTDGTPLIVEYWEPGTWERDIVFPGDVYIDD